MIKKLCFCVLPLKLLYVFLLLLQADKPLVNLGCFPSYFALKGAVLSEVSYGYVCAPYAKTCPSESAVAG